MVSFRGRRRSRFTGHADLQRDSLLDHPDKDAMREGTPPTVIGPSLVLKGELTGEGGEFLIYGIVEGRIDLKGCHVVIGPGGMIQGDIIAKMVSISGQVYGNVTAQEKVEVCETGCVRGNIMAPRIIMIEGAAIRGQVETGEVSEEDLERYHEAEEHEEHEEQREAVEAHR